MRATTRPKTAGVPMKAAVYARYSTDKQDARSTEDQIRRCRRFAEAQGFSVVEVYEDQAVSGAHAARAALQQLLRDARRPGGSPFSAVLVDDQSRLARDLGTAWRLIFEDLPPLGVKVVDCTTGRASDETGARLTFGVTALMNDAFLEMVRTETHRGMEGRALAGFATGGRTYGYRTQREQNPADPEHPRSEIAIDENQAAVVRRIFEAWNRGDSVKTIAVALNDEGIAAPHDNGTGNKGNRGWIPTTIRSMLLNDRYIGKLVWNKTKWVKDRTTGKRKHLPNPPEEWVTLQREDLRIIDDHTYSEAQERFRSGRGIGRPAGTYTKRISLCAGLLRCGMCGGSLTIVGQRTRNGTTYRQYGCTTYYSRGSSICSNSMTISELKATEGLLREVRRVLSAPGVVEELMDRYAEKMATLRKSDLENGVQKRLEQAEKKVRNLYEAVGKLGLSESLSAAIRDAEAEMVAAKAAAGKAASSGLVLPHPSRIQAAIRNILETLEKDGQAARELLRKHIGALILTPTADGYLYEGGFLLGLRGDPDAPAEAGSAGVSGFSSSGGRI